MRYFAAILVLLAAGCATKPGLRPTDASVSLGGSIKGAWGHTESAEYDNQQAKKYVKDPTGIAFNDAVTQEHGAVLKDLTTAGAALDTTNAQYAKALSVINNQNTTIQLQAQRLDADDKLWIGARTKRVAGWLVGSAVLVAFLAFAFRTFAGGLLASVGGGIMHLLPHFLTRYSDSVIAKRNG